MWNALSYPDEIYNPANSSLLYRGVEGEWTYWVCTKKPISLKPFCNFGGGVWTKRLQLHSSWNGQSRPVAATNLVWWQTAPWPSIQNVKGVPSYVVNMRRRTQTCKFGWQTTQPKQFPGWQRPCPTRRMPTVTFKHDMVRWHLANCYPQSCCQPHMGRIRTEYSIVWSAV